MCKFLVLLSKESLEKLSLEFIAQLFTKKLFSPSRYYGQDIFLDNLISRMI